MRGPQVSAWSSKADTGPLLQEGWLHTGDLGEITPEGNLVIIGRKKEILITSYGKNIHPARIEGLLRQIPGMADAMVLGDNRPSLCALLWVNEGSATRQTLHAIDRAVAEVNDTPVPPRAAEALGGALGAPRHRERRADRQPEDPPAGGARPQGRGGRDALRTGSPAGTTGPMSRRSPRACSTWGPADAPEPVPPHSPGRGRTAHEVRLPQAGARAAVRPDSGGVRRPRAALPGTDLRRAAPRVRPVHPDPGRGGAAARG